VWTRKQQQQGLPILPQGQDGDTLANEPFRFFVRADGTYVLDGKAGDYLSTDSFDYGYDQPVPEAGKKARVAAAKPMPAVKAKVKAGVATVTLPAAPPQAAANAAARPVVATITVPRSADPSSPRQFDVLVNAPANVTEVSADSPYYGGTVGSFGPPMPGMVHDATFTVPLSPKLQALSAAATPKAKAGVKLEIRLVPSSAKDKPAPAIKALSIRRL
jgi:tyrosinase